MSEKSSRPRGVENMNELRSTAFEMSIPKIKNTVYAVQQTSVPGTSITPILIPNIINPVWEPGEILTYDDLSASFIVDEDMQNYIDIYNWLRELGFPTNHREYNDNKADQTSDVIISTFTNTFSANVRIHYKNAFPVSLSEIPFDTTVTSIEPISATVVFKYESYEIIPIRT